MASCSIILPGLIVLGGILLPRVSYPAEFSRKRCLFRGFQTWIYYPTWTRLDPLVFGVVLAAIEKFRPRWWPPDESCSLAFAARARPHHLRIISGRRRLSHRAAAIWQFPVDRSRNGRVTCLRGQSAANFTASKNSRRRVFRQHRL